MTRTRIQLRTALLATFASTWLAACGGGGGAAAPATTTGSDAGAAPLAAGSPAPVPPPSAAPSAMGPAPGPSVPSSTAPGPSPAPSPVAAAFSAFAPEAIAQSVGVPIPQVARLRGGGNVVVWAAGPQVWAQRTDSGGQVLGSPIALGVPTSQDIPNASVAATADGGFIVAVQVADSAPASDMDLVRAVQVRRFGADGTLLFDVRAHEGRYNHVGTTPLIRAAADGSFVVAWIASAAYKAPSVGYLQRLGADGSRIGPLVTVGASMPQVAQITPVLLADGSLLALSLQLEGDASTGQRWAMHGQHFGADLTPLAADARLDLWSQAERFPFDAAPLANGNAALAWVTNTGGGVYRVQSTVLTTAGTPAAGVESYQWPNTIWQVASVGVTPLADGFAVAWQALAGYNRGTVGELWMQRHAAGGAASEPPAKLTGMATLSVSPTTGASSHAWPGFTLDGGADGHFVSAFQSIPETVFLMGQ